MADDPEINPEDKDLFRQAVGPVKRLKTDKITPPRSKTRTRKVSPQTGEYTPVRDILSDEYEIEAIAPEAALEFARSGVQQSVMRKLRRGQLPQEGELDLHGLTMTEARAELLGFLNECSNRGIRTVRIIHGKGYGSQEGKPILKGMVNSWLKQLNSVLAFCSAQPRDGGRGAVYVLLKRHQK